MHSVVDGGVGIAENLNVGGAIDVTDAATTRNNLGIFYGQATISNGGAGTKVVVSNNNVISTSIIIISPATNPGGASSFYVGTILDNTSFEIVTTGTFNTTDLNYLIINN